jgi:ribonuclease HI
LKANILRIYTDGACAGNPGPGGWGVMLQYGSNIKEIFGHELQTTNNRMEIKAAIEALRTLKTCTCDIEIYTDSKYVQLGITQWIHKWIKNNWCTTTNKLVKNSDLWQQLYLELGKYNNITWHWVRGHSNNIGNEIADRLANQGKEMAIRVLKCQH